MTKQHPYNDELRHQPASDGFGSAALWKENQKLHRHKPTAFSDRISRVFTYSVARGADRLFGERYAHRAIVLETVAAIPGFVGGFFQHLRSLRKGCTDQGWVATLVDEAENERLHLMVYLQIAKPTFFERVMILGAQITVSFCYAITYLLSPRIAHRFVGYLEEEAVHSYTGYLAHIDAHPELNVPAPAIAISYWTLAPDARLRDVIVATRADEMLHRDVNHSFADTLL